MIVTNEEFQPGDHLFVYCQGYSHHGIHIGQDRVIHFDSTPGRKAFGSFTGDAPKICEVPIATFSGGKEIHVRKYRTETSDPKETLSRAHSRLGENGYDLFDNNSEHFAVWCKTGNSVSTQVNSVRRVARTGAAGIAFSSAVLRSARFLPLPYRAAAYTAGAAFAIGATTYRLVSEKRKNRENQLS